MATALALKYKIRFDLTTSPPSLIFTDLIDDDYNTLYGYTLANIKGLIRITSPVGVIYANAGYVAGSFAAPDTKGAATAVWEKSGIALPLDADDKVVLGDYKVEYKVSVDGTTVFITDEFTYNLQFVTPSVVLTPTANVRTSRLTVVDDTDYVVEGKSPTNDLAVARLQTVIFPPTSAQANQTSSDETFAVTGNLWSGNFTSKVLTSGLVYNMDTWTDGTVSVEVKTNVQGETAIEVESDDCACTYYACIYSIEEKYRTAKFNGNLREADRLMSVRVDLAFYHEMYNLAITCGENSVPWCDKIKEVSQSENCMCPEDSGSTLSAEIIPVTTPPAVIGGSGTLIYSGSGAPDGALGADNSYYIRTDAGNEYWYNKLSGAWTQLFLIKGAKGDTGDKIISIIHSFIGELKSDGTAEVDLAAYTLDNTPDPIMANTGDILKVVASFKLAQNDNGKRMKLYLGSQIIAEYFTDADVDSSNDKVQLEAEITKRTSNVASVKSLITRGGTPGIVKNLLLNIAVSENLHADFAIKTTGQNTVAALGEITCQELRIEHTKYQESVQSEDASLIPYLKQQGFVATAGQTEFVITDVTLNSDYVVFVNGALQSFGHSRSGNTVIFSVGLDAGTEVIILN